MNTSGYRVGDAHVGRALAPVELAVLRATLGALRARATRVRALGEAAVHLADAIETDVEIVANVIDGRDACVVDLSER